MTHGVDADLQRLAELARKEATRGDMAIDIDAYQRADRDPLAPLIGGGALEAAVGFFGRDPGRDEITHMEPLIGAAGQLVRAGVHRKLYGGDPPNFEASRALAQRVFFSNTVPYKPLGNKAWSMAVKRRFRAVIASYLVDHWRGRELITLGNVAFHWFVSTRPGRSARDSRASSSWGIDMSVALRWTS